MTKALRRRPGTALPGPLGHQPDPYVRAVLQSAVGVDLGDVRVHGSGDHDAALDAAGVDALTSGRDVVLRREHDHPGTPGNRVLLLHELVHVLQQAGRDRTVADRRTPAELEAHAHRVAVDLAVRPPHPAAAAP